jgi:hypothetical protein
MPGFHSGPELYVDSRLGTLAFFALLPVEPDGTTMDADAILIPTAELVVAAIEADGG